jgi:hypothetical protein
MYHRRQKNKHRAPRSLRVLRCYIRAVVYLSYLNKHVCYLQTARSSNFEYTTLQYACPWPVGILPKINLRMNCTNCKLQTTAAGSLAQFQRLLPCSHSRSSFTLLLLSIMRLFFGCSLLHNGQTLPIISRLDRRRFSHQQPGESWSRCYSHTRERTTTNQGLPRPGSPAQEPVSTQEGAGRMLRSPHLQP